MNLRDWLYKNRINIKKFSCMIGVDRSYVHRWMKGKNIPSAHIVDKIRNITMNQVNDETELKDNF